MTFRAACMTPEESRLWEAANRQLVASRRVKRPCVDCSIEFAARMADDGRCNGVPRTPIDPNPSTALLARRRYNRGWMRARRLEMAT